MCKKCGCNTCETDSTALMLNESKAPRTILSEGLKHHIDANKPLTDNFCYKYTKHYLDSKIMVELLLKKQDKKL